ncbi:hypothetical protein [Kitasatospora sp. NPDC094015]|uniref:hypothetical protein n=1 Tax=Kitasatospora sp. NPDC094015 TaxID=3155205 RepID=UPI00332EA10D
MAVRRGGLVFVAVDADGQSHRVPALIPESPVEQRRERLARERRARRRSGGSD